MPGTIQVSVVEFKSSSTSPTSLKVSMGRRGYETWDNGDFSFPVTTLRENLIVALQDVDGKEIAHTGVGIMLIVEKGSWDDYFPLEGGGEVHMKLHFVLSEEDRDRVRLLRESALRKKQQKESTESVEGSSVDFEQKITGMLKDIMRILPSQDTEMSVRRKVVSAEDEAVDTSSLLCPFSEYYHRFGTVKEDKKSSALLRINDSSDRMEDPHGTEVQRDSVEVHETIPRRAKVDHRPSSDQEASSKLGFSGSEFQFEKNSISPKLNDETLDKSEVQKPIKRTPSAVWKMISAFETNLSQDPRSSVKSPNLKSQSDQVEIRGYLKDTNSKDVTTPAESDSDFRPNLFPRKETSSFTSGKAVNVSFDSQAGEKLTAQKHKFTEPERENVCSTRISDESGEEEEEDIDIKRVVRETSEVSNSEELVKLPLDLIKDSERTFSGRIPEENNSFENLVMETIPNNARHLCITTAGKKVMSFFKKQEPEESKVSDSANPGPGSIGEGVISQGDHPKKNDYRGYGQQKNSRPVGSPDAPGGFVGQAIKLAVIVGFGVLVLLTRQKEPRKDKTEANNRLNDPPGFMDEGPYIIAPMH